MGGGPLARPPDLLSQSVRHSEESEGLIVCSKLTVFEPDQHSIHRFTERIPSVAVVFLCRPAKPGHDVSHGSRIGSSCL